MFESGFIKKNIGSGSPKLTIVACQHGNEHTGLIIYNELKGRESELKNEIELIIANPQALLYNDKNGVDTRDLNRIFPGSKKGGRHQRLASLLFEELKNKEFVIDMHSWNSLNTPIYGIMMVNSDKEILRENIKLLSKLKPKSSFFVKENQDLKYSGLASGTLVGELMKRKVPAIALEINSWQGNIESDVKILTESLINFNQEPKKLICLKERLVQTSEYYGIFKPLKKPLEIVKVGEIIGTLLDLGTDDIREIKSVYSGRISQIHWNAFLLEGETLLSVEGKELN